MTALIKPYGFIKTIENELKTLESTMLEELQGYDPTLIEAATHLMKAGGKRLRPSMVLLSAKATFSQELTRAHYLLAMAVEVLHTATLIHDDIIDGASTRRGLPTVNQTWGQRVSVLAGDFLLARSCYYISVIEKVRLNTVFSQMVMDMCNGEMSQFQRRYKSTMTLQEYLEQIECKTALLMAVGCQGAAIINQTSPQIEKALYDFGYNIGMAFQIMDDILDFSVTERELGKSACNDLIQGQVTLPTLYALEQAPEATLLRSLIDRQFQESGDLDRALEIVKSSSALTRSQQTAEAYRDQALAVLSVLPESEYCQGLMDLAEMVIERKH